MSLRGTPAVKRLQDEVGGATAAGPPTRGWHAWATNRLAFRDFAGHVPRIYGIAQTSTNLFAWAATLSAMGVIAFALWVAFPIGGDTVRTAIDDIGEALVAFIAAASCAAAGSRSSGRLRLAWWLLAASAASWGLGQVFVSFYEVGLGVAVPFPSVADIGFLAAMPLAFAGVIALLLNPSRAVSFAREALDGGILALSLLFVGEAIGLGNTGSTGQAVPLAPLVGIAHPLGGLLIIAVILWPIRQEGLRLQGPMLLLLGGLATNSVPDIAFSYLSASGSHGAFSSLMGAGRVLGYLLIALAALWPASSRRSTPHKRPVEVWQVMMPWMALLGVAITAGVLAVTGHPFAPRLAAIGAPLALLLVLSELQSRRSEAMFTDRTALLDQIISRAPFGVARVRMDMTLIDAHRRMASMVDGATGKTPASTMADFLPPEEIPRVVEKFQQLRDGSVESIEAENPGLREDGTKGWLQWTATTVKKEDGSIDYFLVTFADTTARHQADVAAARNLNVLERLNRLKTEFLTMVSHEFRTALVGIQGFSELMRDPESVDLAEVKSFANEVYEEARRLDQMLDKMLELDRVAGSRTVPQIAQVDLNDAVNDVVAAVGAAAHGHQVVTDIEPALPMVRGDSAKLRQVLSTLLSNAIKYSPEGSEVAVSGRAEPGYVQISVKDHGMGMPTDFDEQLFGRYRSNADNPTSKVIGSGLGLPVAREIVELHGGRIWFDSVTGVGSEFHFIIPIAAQPTPAKARQSSDSESRIALR